jgi:osmotically-inducible protein OsmY
MAMSTMDRTDVDLRSRVLQQLEYTPEVDAHDIGVMAENGVVTLTGFVETFSEKRAAERAAKAVVGVRALANDIQVKGVAGLADPDIARMALAALRSRVSVPSTVHVVVRNGYVVLEGAVTWMYQKEAAEAAVAYLHGVVGVDNRIVLRPVVSTMDVKDRIDAALGRAAHLHARDIAVSASDGVVRLTGVVQSYLEKEDAGRAAWGAAGVRHVDNALSVRPPAR